MRGKNIIEINQATMLEAIDLWLADQFKSPPKAKSVSESRNSVYQNSFKIELKSPSDTAE